MNDDERGPVGDLARRFLNAFHTIESLLRKQQNKDQWVPFTDLVRDSKQLGRTQRTMLSDLASLRNAIAHTPYDDRDEPYANPRSDTVDWIERQVDVIGNPPKVLAALKLQRPSMVNGDDRLSSFLRLIAAPYHYSQAPVVQPDGSYSLITTNAVSRWLATQFTNGVGYLAEDPSIAVVVETGTESRDRLLLKSRHYRVVDALRELSGKGKVEPPAAVLITETGRAGEEALGIVTSFDIPAMVRELGI